MADMESGVDDNIRCAVRSVDMDSGRRCYLCKRAMAIVEHKEDPARKFWIRCSVDNADYEPGGACTMYKEADRTKEQTNGTWDN